MSTNEPPVRRPMRRTDSTAKSAETKPEEGPKVGILLTIRGYLDALVFAYVLAMFIRTFAFELFMIPTGSMTPTLIGDADRFVVPLDYNGDGTEDFVAVHPGVPGRALAYLMDKEGRFSELRILENLPVGYTQALRERSPGRKDMILVNKFAYWFAKPDRGDIIVFKVPDKPNLPTNPFDPEKPIYIKRCVGAPGDEVMLQPVEHEKVPAHSPKFAAKLQGLGPGVYEVIVKPRPLMVNGQPVPGGDPLGYVPHFPPPRMYGGAPDPREPVWHGKASDEEVFMMGDNGASSSDSRYWGGVPLTHLRGRAILRYWPWRKARWLE